MRTFEQINESGMRRHRDRWFHANRRAVEVIWGTKFRPNDPEVKQMVSQIILSILDGAQVDAGNNWVPKSGQWVSRKELAASALRESGEGDGHEGK